VSTGSGSKGFVSIAASFSGIPLAVVLLYQSSLNSVREEGKEKRGKGDPVITIRPVTKHDSAVWLEMRRALWPEHGDNDHAPEIQRFLAGELKMPLAVLLAEDDKGDVLGFVELSIRPYAEGCLTDRVAFLEGWYVIPEARRSGVGRALVAAAEEWAHAQGCTEFGSDAEADNTTSADAHRALGFEQVVIIRCFRKDLA
jgi:aminoglycoside 6'-N-acetyltransferase I